MKEGIIPAPPIDPDDLSIIVCDSHGNFAVNVLSKHATDMAEPKALGHLVQHLIAKLVNPT